MSSIGVGLLLVGASVMWLAIFDAISERVAFRIWCAGAICCVLGAAVVWTVHP